VDSGHHGLGQRGQPAVRRISDGPDRPETVHRHARAPVHSHLVADAVRADHVVPVHGPDVGGRGQGHVVHGGAGVPGRNSGREHPRRAEQRVLSAAAPRAAGGGGDRGAGVVPDAEHDLGRGPGAVLPGGRLDPRVAVLSVETAPAGRGGRVSAVVQGRRRRRRRARRAAAHGGQREDGHGEPVDVPRAVREPQGQESAGDRGGGVRVSAGRRHQLRARVLGAHTARPRARRRQERVHHAVHRAAGVGELRRGGRGRQGGQETVADTVRGGHGRGHVRVRRLLLSGRRRRGHVVVRVAAVPVPRAVRRDVRRGRRLRAGRAARRDVPRERPLALFRHRFRHVGLLFVRHQQDVPRRLPALRVPRHVRRFHRHQRRRRRVLVRLRRRDQRQNVPANPRRPERPRESQRNQKRTSKYHLIRVHACCCRGPRDELLHTYRLRLLLSILRNTCVSKKLSFLQIASELQLILFLIYSKYKYIFTNLMNF